MDFRFTEEQTLCQNMAEEFARNYFEPYAKEWDAHSYFPIDALKEAARLGMGAIVASPDTGGSGLSRLSSAVIFEALATGCVSTAAYLSIHNMVAALIDKYGNDEQRHQWVPSLASMEAFASYCLTEPGSGSDAAALKTKALREGDHYIVNGAKAFISGASVSDLYLCMVRTGEDKHKGISCLVIEKDTPGLTFGEQEKKLGWKSQPTAMVYFENCRVPVSNRIGEEGMGFKMALNALNGGRISIAACSLGGAKRCLLETKRYMHERQQFDKKLKDMQALRFMYADMVTQYESARLLVHRAASMLDEGEVHAVAFCAMAKKLATDVAFEIANSAMQLHGGYGYLQDYPIERLFRDLRVHQILEGTNQIMQELIAKAFLDEA